MKKIIIFLLLFFGYIYTAFGAVTPIQSYTFDDGLCETNDSSKCWSAGTVAGGQLILNYPYKINQSSSLNHGLLLDSYTLDFFVDVRSSSTAYFYYDGSTQTSFQNIGSSFLNLYANSSNFPVSSYDRHTVVMTSTGYSYYINKVLLTNSESNYFYPISLSGSLFFSTPRPPNHSITSGPGYLSYFNIYDYALTSTEVANLSDSSNGYVAPPPNQTCTTELLNYPYIQSHHLNSYSGSLSYENDVDYYVFTDVLDRSYYFDFQNVEIVGSPLDYGTNTGNLENINSGSGLTINIPGTVESPFDYFESDIRGIGLISDDYFDYLRIDSSVNFNFWLYSKNPDGSFSEIKETPYSTNEDIYFVGDGRYSLYIAFASGPTDTEYNINDIYFGQVTPQLIESETCVDNDTGIIYVDGIETGSGDYENLKLDIGLLGNDLESSLIGDDLIDTIKLRLDTYMSLFSLDFSISSNTFSLYLPTGSNNLEFEEYNISIDTEGYTPTNVISLGTDQTTNDNYNLIVYVFGLLFIGLYIFIIFLLIKYVIFGFILFFLSFLFKLIKLISFNFFGNSFENKTGGNIIALPLLFSFFALFIIIFDYFLGDYFDLFVGIFQSMRNIIGNFLNFVFMTFFNDSKFFIDGIFYLNLSLKPLIIALFIFLVTKKYSKLV